ncbi:serine--tRNA ligase [Stratiformator vulcanicus]|uniref:Serine--tRNA ligase n=1 Tax=Stratiformator vulcanicus TaxID=2527980 RepID=A0A517R1B8_9PLAN|nr:serine--tRNA ligase [Stratiformator vulcanicus]QDT37671.1 Serine--tRNA ligase [Stratiformator vulcanicus]
MLDLNFICDNREAVEQNCRDRGVKADVGEVVRLRDERRDLITREEELRREQKETSAKIPKATADERPALIERGKSMRGQISAIEEQRKEVERQLYETQALIPNLTHADTPIGGEDDAKVLRTVGDPPEFDFKALDHVELAEKHDLIDFEAGARVAGSGFYFLKNEAALLELALMQYAVQHAVKAGFTICTTPDLARDDVLAGIGFNPRGDETQIYSVQGSDLSLVATAEITLGGAMRDQVVDTSSLPKKVAGISHCFRTEAGAHGKASRGIYRVHQFTKVELFAFTAPDLDVSNQMHAEILAVEEAIFQGLGIPYQVVDIATGDLGGPAYRKFDIEAWMPGRGDAGEYGEVTSASNCTDYQSRRLGIRCKQSDKKGTEFVHTLNGTAVAVTRALIAVLENNQQADGTISIPEVLRPWVGKDRIG